MPSTLMSMPFLMLACDFMGKSAATSVQNMQIHTHAQARLHACTHAQTHTDTHILEHTHTRSFPLSRAVSLARTRTHTRTHARTHKLSRSLVLSLSLTFSLARFLTDAYKHVSLHTDSHTHTPYLSLSLTHIDEIAHTRSLAAPLSRVPLQVTLSRSRSTRPDFVYQRLARARAAPAIPIF